MISRCELQRDHLLRGRNLRHDRPETRKEQRAHVESILLEKVQDLVCDPFRMLKAKRADGTQLDVIDDLFLELTAKLLVAFAAHAEEFDLLALGD